VKWNASSSGYERLQHLLFINPALMKINFSGDTKIVHVTHVLPHTATKSIDSPGESCIPFEIMQGGFMLRHNFNSRQNDLHEKRKGGSIMFKVHPANAGTDSWMK
jgi:hypothetical protein